MVITTLVVLAVVILRAASPASSSDNRETSVRWDHRTFTSATALSSYVSARGVDPDRFFAAHPGVVQAFDLTAVRWDGKPFYTLAGMRRWHARAEASFARWAMLHPTARRALTGNAQPTASLLSYKCRNTSCMAPASTSAPTTSGSARVGLAVTVSSGGWGPSKGLSYAYQWQRCSTTSTCSWVSGADSQTYTVQGADVGNTLRAVVTVRNRYGFGVATSNAIGPATAASLPNTATEGGATVAPPLGSTLPGSTGTSAGATTGTPTGPSAPTAATPTPTPPPAAASNPTATPALSTKFGIAAGGGIEGANDADLARELDGYKTIGAGWLRSDLKWAVVESTRGVFKWSIYDRLVAAARARGINIVFGLETTPAWARPAGAPDDDKYAPANPNDFGPFVRAAVAHFSPQGVKVFEVWNEPNNDGFWKPAPNAAQYTELLKVAYANAKAADPSVTVLAGAFSPVGGYNDPLCGGSGTTTQINPINFLEQIYAHGGTFDALSTHPYDSGGPKGTHRCSAWYQMFGTSPSLLSTMQAHGDGSKKIWATEFGTDLKWVGNSQSAQAQQITDGMNLWRTYPWAGGMMVYAYHQTLGGFDLVNSDWSPRAAWYAYQAAPK